MDIFLALAPSIIAFITLTFSEILKLSINDILLLILTSICIFFLIIKVTISEFDWKNFMHFVLPRSILSIIFGVLATYVYTTDSYINVFLIGYTIMYITAVRFSDVKDISNLIK